ncbi:hypothetical protein DFH09DRAFT_1316119 [Mycena vulgaris]|nr:hypothetical protein DFH09DRAFT_1316119 [Mycena vulgaris]
MPGPALAHNASEYTPAQAEEYVRITITQNYVLYATSALLVYELLTTFDEEVERVWSFCSSSTDISHEGYYYYNILPVVILGHLNPCPCIFQVVLRLPRTLHSCRIYGYWQVIPPRLAILAAQAVMVIRLWAIYNNSRPMLYVLVTLFTLEVAAVVACMTMATLVTQGTSQLAPLSCGLDALSPLLREYASGTWIAPVCFELVILMITLVKIFPPLPALVVRRLSFTKGFGVATRERNPTLDMLARDSIIYFAFIFTPHPPSHVSRMIINIRSLPAPNLTHPTSASISFEENAEYNQELSGVSEVRRSSVTRTLSGRVSGKDREADDYEMIATPGSPKGLADV